MFIKIQVYSGLFLFIKAFEKVWSQRIFNSNEDVENCQIDGSIK